MKKRNVDLFTSPPPAYFCFSYKFLFLFVFLCAFCVNPNYLAGVTRSRCVVGAFVLAVRIPTDVLDLSRNEIKCVRLNSAPLLFHSASLSLSHSLSLSIIEFISMYLSSAVYISPFPPLPLHRTSGTPALPVSFPVLQQYACVWVCMCEFPR